VAFSRCPGCSNSMRVPAGGRGDCLRSVGLHFGQGIPAPPQLQACSPAQGVSGWFSHTRIGDISSGEQLRAGLGELHVGAGLVLPEPAALDRQL
jgi:hypothetical protein